MALIVARLGPLCDGLRALLTAIRRIKTIAQVDDLPAALPVVAEHRPALLLVDCNPANHETCTLLEEIKVRSPESRIVILAEDVRQQAIAQAVGADAVLLKGAPAEELFAMLEGLLPQ
jgi:DNA-binding NarL/FixJ family response regulator